MTDRFEFVTLWRRKDKAGALRDYAELRRFDTLQVARDEHRLAVRGGWVRHGMHDPHVSALRVRKEGRLLPEELAPAVDVAEFARTTSGDDAA